MNTPELDATVIGSELGEESVNSVVGKMEQLCAHEERRIELQNQPDILARKAEFSLLRDREEELRDRLRFAPPPGGLRHQRRKRISASVITILLTAAGFVFVALTFEPFRLGWKGYVYSLGIAITVPYLVETILQSVRSEHLRKALTGIAVVAGISSLILLAVIRGNLLAQQIQNTPSLVVDDAQPAPDNPNPFYESTVGLLRLATALLSLSMELAAGLALREAWSPSPDPSEDWKALRCDLVEVQQRMVGIVHEVTRLQNEPRLFGARFWRDFYSSMLTHTLRNAMTKLMVVLAGILCLSNAHAASPRHLDLVVAIDLTRSVAVKGPDGTTEFQKNIDGVTRVLAQVPSGAHVTVIGITDRSFAQPYILLSASLPEDPGYFGERLGSARRELVRVWKTRSAKLAPSFPATDVLGALMLASQIFDRQPSPGEQKTLILFSDMRNHTTELDLESSAGVAASLKDRGLIKQHSSDLRNVQTFALGVSGAANTTIRWQAVETFWGEYLDVSGAMLRAYSPLRTIPVVVTTK